ncbi:MAG: hypothetical protein ACP6IU_14955 [Candidatus Asgardarchaeia archaeon]
MNKSVIVKMSLVLCLMFVIGFSATVTAASASRTTIKSNIKIADGYGYVDIYVDDYGKVEIDVVTMELLDTNLSAFQIQPDSEMYAKMAVFSISITDEPLFTFGVGYKGDVAANATYLNWAQSIRDTIISFFEDSYTFSDEESTIVYSDSENITYYVWNWYYTTTDSWRKTNEIIDQYLHNDFKKFMMFNSDWTFEEFDFSFSKTKMEVNATGTSIIEAVGNIQVFSGNGTHEFNLRKIIGYTEPPFGISYTLSVTLPLDAEIHQDTIDAGNATVSVVTEDQILLNVGSSQTIGNLTFTFDYNFTSPEDGGGETPPEEETPTTGEESESSSTGLLGGYDIYTIGGVAIVAIIFAIVKFFLRKQNE